MVKARRYLAVSVCAVVAASMLVPSSPAAADLNENCSVKLVVTGMHQHHLTSYIVQFEGQCGSAPITFSWEHNAPCPNSFYIATGDAGEHLSRADWYHGPERDCPHPDARYEGDALIWGDHDVTVSVTVTIGNSVVVCTVQGVQTQGTCTPVARADEGRVASSAFPLSARIAKAQKQLKRMIDPLVAQYNEIAETVVMQQRSVAKEAELHAFRLANVRTIEAQISELRQEIADGIGSEDSAQMERLKTWLKNAQLEALAVRLRLQNKERDLEETIVRRDGVAWQLMRFSQPLEAIDFELRGLVVNAGSKKVYEAGLASPYSRLFQLTRNIRTQRENVEALLAQKKEALKEFSAAHQAASRQLLVIADLIWSNAKKKAAIDAAAHAIDVVNAASKGGWAGVIAEVTSKIYETFMKEVVFADPIGDPNPGQVAIDAWIQESAAETVGENALAIGIERGVKETAVKVAKDWLANGLKEDFPGIFGGDLPSGTPPTAVDDAVRRTTTMRERLKHIAKDRLKTETFQRGFRKWFESGVGRKLLQDSIKAWFNAEFRNAEMAAWAQYMQLDMHAQGWYSVWHAANNAYWEAEDSLVGYELEKERILNEFDPLQLVPVVTVQDVFSIPTMLRIRLVVPRSFGPFEKIPVEIWINGVQARRSSSTQFEISTKQLSGTEFAIEVR